METRGKGVLPAGRRRALLEAAAAEFIRAGYERASLNRVLQAQGMSKSSFYHYFASKEALFGAVITDLGREVAEALEVPSDAALAEDFWAAVGALAERLGDRDAPAFMCFAALFYLPDAPAGPGSPLAAARDAIDGWIDTALATGREAGAIGDRLPVGLQRHLCKAVLWAMDEWTVAHLDALSPGELGALPGAELDALRRLLAKD
ncbi:TetR/AcrR family transcriptional regulator [Glycomyces harbinensis]|uniref:Transcriptional regulator, TetR family n=1 Tax=Glycomyces harbinensis TaxID=58114 RepID=A0A1G6V5M2_9ACTN|nr:TetR/AcrR family transcriptional regulator [Glycomyces harbinensis]SDD48166.1 transcriptional regulator, TetR family [Glycomyces harbinensis]